MAVKAGYKQTEIGVLPDDWETIEYGKCLNIMAGLGFKKSEYSDIGIRLLRIDNVSYGQITWESIAYLPAEYSRKFPHLVLAEDDILLALNRPITNDQLKIAVVRKEDLPAILYQRVGRIGFVNDHIDKDFAFHVLRIYIRKFVEDSSVGSDQPFISTTKLKKILLPVPPTKAEQEAIAESLSDADALIEALEQLIAKKRQAKQGAMQELLTGKRRLPGFNHEWEEKKIEEIALPSSEKNNAAEDLPVLTCSKHLGFVNSLSYFKNQVFSNDTSGYKIIRRGQIGYPANHVEEGSIGIQDLYDVAIVSPIYVVFSVNDEVNSFFLHRLLKLDAYRQKFATETNASVDRRGSLRWPAFSQITVYLPGIEEQTAIAEILSDMDAEIAALEGKLSKARQVKQGMMQELLTGRIRLVES